MTEDEGIATILSVFDFSVAFDTINPGILLGQLWGLELGSTDLSWFGSCFQGKSQQVLLGNERSSPQLLFCNLLQGLPFHFNIYMKLLCEVIMG